MNEREELNALRRLMELEAKARRDSYQHPLAPPEDPIKNDPYWKTAQSDTALENLGAGFGGALYGIPLGLRQMAGSAGPDEVSEWARSMRGLMGTKSGTVGAVGGAAAPAIAAGMFPGGNTVLGAAFAGGMLGGAQPVQEGESRLGNATKGALWNAALPAAVATYKTAGAVTAPFRQGGREAIAGRTLERFATDPNNIQKAGGVQWVAGQPTLAEAAGDTGLANLQRTVQTMDTRGLVAQRFADNNAARVAELAKIAQDDAAMKAAEAARTASTGPLYKAAAQQDVTVDAALRELLNRPSVQQALERAQRLAKEDGRTFDLAAFVQGHAHGGGGGSGPAINQLFPSVAPVAKAKPVQKVSGQTLQDIKMGLDDLLSDPKAGIAGKEAKKAAATRQSFIDWMEQNIPEFKAARTAYAQQSLPINQMQIGQRLLDDATSSLRDFSGNPKLYAEKFARAVDSEDKLVKQATGLKRPGGLDDVMTPNQMLTIRGIVDELSANSAAQAAGRVPGSPTAQYLIGQDVVGRIAGPFGVPKAVAGSTLVENALSRPVTWALKTPEEKLIGLLSEAMLDPKRAAELLKKGRPTPLARKVQGVLDVSSPAVQGLLMGYPSIPALEQ